MGHRAADCEGKVKRKAGEMLDNTETDVVVKKPYEVLFRVTHLNIIFSKLHGM